MVVTVPREIVVTLLLKVRMKIWETVLQQYDATVATLQDQEKLKMVLMHFIAHSLIDIVRIADDKSAILTMSGKFS